MREFWNKITTLGLSENIDTSTALKMRQLNRATIFGFITVLFFSLTFIYLKAYVPLAIDLTMLLLFLVILRLNQKQHFLYARPFYIFVMNAGAVIFASLLGPDAGAELFFFCVISSVFTLFNLSEKYKFFVYVLISPIAWIALELLNYDLGLERINLSPETLTFLFYSCIFISLSLCASLLYQFLYANSLMREKLEDTISKFQTSQKEIQARNNELLRTQKLLSKNQLAIQEEKEIALNALKVKSDFLSSISHEIRTPMNVIMGITDLLLDAEENEEKISNLNLIKKSSDNLLIIINDILDFSKLENGKMTIEKIAFNIKTKLTDEIEGFKHTVYKKGNKITLDFSDEINPFIQGDPVRLGQVILNLLSNANKFTENGDIKISVSLKEVQGNTIQRLLFKISDTGIGISEKAINNIFNSFTQASSSTSRKFGGTGLGLTICKHIIEAMKGRIWAESTLGEGSNFYFDLPFTMSSKEYKNCIVVENFDINRMVINNTLKRLNYSANFCENKPDLKRELDRNDEALVLLNGENFDINAYLKLIPQKSKTIVYGSNKRTLITKLEKNNAIHGILALPFSPSDLAKYL